MGVIKKFFITGALSLVLAVGALPGTAMATEGFFDDDTGNPSAAGMYADALLARPATFAVGVVGAVGWVITLPFTFIGGNPGEAASEMVGGPMKYTFLRPLGHMEQN